MSRRRIRTIKPECWEDESVGRLGPWERLLWIGAITMADDDGRFRALPAAVAGFVFPYDSGAAKRVAKWLQRLADERLVILYEVDGAPVAQVRNWQRHQKVEKRTPSVLPPPPGGDDTPIHSPTSPRKLPDTSRASRASMIHDPDPDPDPEKKLDARASEHDLFAYWQERCRHPNAKPSRERMVRLRQRLKDSTRQEIREAIDGAAKAPYVNDQGHRFDDIELVCRTRAKLEAFIERGRARPFAGGNFTPEMQSEWLEAG